MTEVHQAVVEVPLVGNGERLAARHSTNDGERHVEQRDAEDQQRDGQRREEEVGLADELLAEGVGASSDHARRHGQQQPEEQCAPIAHDDARRVEVVGEESDAHAHGDDGEQRADVAHVEQIAVGEFLAVEEERERRDRNDSGGEPVEPVDQIDCLRHAHQPQHGDERREVGQHDRAVVERQAERVHHDTELHEHDAGEHRAGDLCGCRHTTDVVDEADGEDDRGREQHTERLGVVLEQHVERIDQPGRSHRSQEAHEHRKATHVGQRCLVDRSVVGEIDPVATPRQHADQRRGDECDGGGNGSDQQERTEVGHGRSVYDAG